MYMYVNRIRMKPNVTLETSRYNIKCKVKFEHGSTMLTHNSLAVLVFLVDPVDLEDVVAEVQ